MTTLEAVSNIYDVFPDKPEYVNTVLKDTAEVIKEEARSVFVYNTKSDIHKVIELYHATQKIPRREILRAGFSAIQGLLPNSVNYSLQEKTFEKVPLDVENDNEKLKNYRILEKIGSGGVNTVYFLANEGKSYAVGLKRGGFDSSSEAIRFADYEQKEYEYFARLYKDVEGLVPKENNIVYENYEGKPSVMFVREFVPGSLRDFFSTDETEIVNLAKNNKQFADQFLKFAEVTKNNRDLLQNYGFDLLGINNLAIAGEDENPKIALIETHTILSYDEKNKSAVSRRLDQIQSIADKITSSTAPEI